MARSAAARAEPARRSRPAPRGRPAPARRPPRRTSGHVRLPAHAAPQRAPASLRRHASAGLAALLHGRAWIALVTVLLAGIVFFNVDLLQMNRDIAQMAERTAALKRQNAQLRAREAELAGSERIQEAAADLGLVQPAPGEVRYLRAKPMRDAQNAAKRITAPDPSLAPATAFVAPAPATTTPVTTTPITTAPATTTTTPPATDPVTGAPVSSTSTSPPTVDPASPTG